MANSISTSVSVDALYLAFFDALPGSSILLQNNPPTFTILAATAKYLKDTGSNKEHLIGKGIFEAFPANPNDSRDTGARDLKNSLTKVHQDKKSHQLPMQRYDLRNEDGSFTEHYWQAENNPVSSSPGEIAYIIHTAEDITAKIKFEQQKEKLKGLELAQNIFLRAPMIIGILRGEKHVLELANEEALRFWNKTEDIIGKPLLEGIPELQGQDVFYKIDRVFKTGQTYYGTEVLINSKDGLKEGARYFDIYYKPFHDTGQRSVSGVFTLSYDVTEKVLAKRTIEESDQQLKDMVSKAPIGLCVIEAPSLMGQIVNQRFVEIAGKPIESIVGNMYWDTFAEVRESYEKELKRVVEEGIAYHAEEVELMLIRYGKKEKVHVSFVYEPMKDATGTVRKVAIWVVDNTLKVADRKKIEESEEILRNIIVQSPIAMSILKGPTHIVEIANDRMFEIWGRGQEELLNKPIFEGLPEVQNQGYEQLLNNVFTTGERYTADGSPVTLPRNGGIELAYINFLYEPYRDANGAISGIMAVAMDVTDQVLARMKVEESNKEFQFVTDFMPQMIWVTRPDGYHYYYNKQWYDYTGLTYEETEGQGWNAVFHPDDQELAWKHWRHSLETGDPYEIEYRCRRFDGQYRWVLGRALPLKDDAGNILKWFGTCTDIDDQKREAQLLEEKVKERTIELESQKKELERSNAHLEDFAYAASHDLKEPVRKIRTFSDKLKNKFQGRMSEDDQHYFERMQRATDRMQLLIDDLLEYSHVSASTRAKEEIDLNRKVATVLEDLELDIAENNAKVIVNKLPVILGHRMQMQQLFQNLITNALKFRKPNVSPEIRICSELVSGQSLTSFNISENWNDELYHVIEISDNGIGFEQEYAERIFKMFQRLHGKAEYEGTGIGLAIVKKVVENHNGFITAESKLGEGARFKVILPADI
ncbi:PAS domain-containing protein [Segetibacter aerophilus]|uniref:histidine kinase n=1 Tax=Segetibacter aerophilus TaxID=670293 RepID=A0A512BJS1_9BACT|nr:PAS domain-containing protein [Segetibacter aerophilus]GEO12135.1 hypothetical protein SAE01_46310 [Segetibacter aerophilus]